MISQEIFLTSWYWYVSNASRDPFVLLLSRVQSQSNATSKSKLVIERQRAKNKATQLHSVVLDSILRFDTPIQYSVLVAAVCQLYDQLLRSSTIRRYLVFIACYFVMASSCDKCLVCWTLQNLGTNLPNPKLPMCNHINFYFLCLLKLRIYNRWRDCL